MCSQLQRVLFRDGSENENEHEHEHEEYDESMSSDPLGKHSECQEMGSLADHLSESDEKMEHIDTSEEDKYGSMLCHQLENLKETISPGYVKKVRALHLFESPQTPKTLLRRAGINDVGTTIRLFKGSKSRVLFKDDIDTSFIEDIPRSKGTKRRNVCSPLLANINPFTPTGMLLQQSRQKRQKTSSLNGSFLNHNTSVDSAIKDMFEDVEEDSELDSSFKIGNCLIAQSSFSRYTSDFVEICQIGTGEFGSVYKCVNRLDGCLYALKRSRKPLRGSLNEKRALNEVYAHAVLGRHSRVVQYYSAWAENQHMYIQNEYCEKGSLSSLITDMKSKDEMFTEAQLRKVLLHVAQGLKYIHSQKLVHLDIKPANIFISLNSDTSCDDPTNGHTDSSDDGLGDEIHTENNVNNVTYKIGDLGLVTCILDPQVEEGDCRYLPLEILHENYSQLQKADIFSLGLTIFEMGSVEPLPKNGDKWHAIREGEIPNLSQCSDEFNKLIKKMIHKDPEKRPSASSLAQHPVLVPNSSKSRTQLRKELNMANLKIENLSQKLEGAVACFNSSENSSSKRGTNFSRSKSVTFF